MAERTERLMTEKWIPLDRDIFLSVLSDHHKCEQLRVMLIVLRSVLRLASRQRVYRRRIDQHTQRSLVAHARPPDAAGYNPALLTASREIISLDEASIKST
jgi:hypothetical protein